jgi:hypothetical protein
LSSDHLSFLLYLWFSCFTGTFITIGAMTKEGEETITYQDGGDIDTVVGEKKGTVADVEDMKRMGKQQLFRVCPLLHTAGANADCLPAQLLLPNDLWLCHDLDANMASSSWVRFGLLVSKRAPR